MTYLTIFALYLGIEGALHDWRDIARIYVAALATVVLWPAEFLSNEDKSK